MTTAKEYIHQPSIGDLQKCRAINQEISPSVKSMYESGLIKGYTIDIIKDLDQAYFHTLDDSFLEKTKGIYPFLYLIIQPNENEEIESYFPFLNSNYTKL